MAEYINLTDSGVGTDTLTITDITSLVNKYRLDRTKEDTIYDWAVASLGPDIRVIWDKPNEDRPPLPYVTLNIISGPIMLGDRPATKYKSLDTWVYQFKYRITLSVNVIGYAKHQEMMATLLNSLHLGSKIEILNLGGLANWGYDGPRDLSTFMDTEWEYRSQADIFLSYGEDVEDVTGEIQKLEVNGQIIEIP